MRLTFFAAVLSSVVLSSAAVAADSSSGCGLGWQVAPKMSIMSSSTRNITHYFLPNTFSMTSGTSGCANHSIVKNDKKTLHFVEANFNQIQNELAIGDQEYTAALAMTLGCSSAVNATVGSVLRAHYDDIYRQQPASAGEVVTQIKNVIYAYPDLALQCVATS